MSDTFGWDLLYKITKDDLNKKEDVLILLLHFLMIKAGYKCVGLGDEKTLTGNEYAGETLPACWNATNHYFLRYVQNDHLYILRGVPVADNILYNLLRVDTLAVTNVVLNINDTVEETRGTLETLFKNKASELIDKIRLELLNTGPGKEATTQTTATAENNANVQEQTGTSSFPVLRSPSPAPFYPSIWDEPDVTRLSVLGISSSLDLNFYPSGRLRRMDYIPD